MGFEINPYDPCVANKMINGSQMTVTWHVDDLKISHKESDEVTKFIRELGQLYDNDLTVCRGKAHSYLGMHFDHSTSGTVKISMIPYLKQIIDDFPEPVTSTAPTPAGDHLCTVRPDDERILLPEEQAQAFHRTTAQLLFLSQQEPPDMQTLVSFLTKRARSPDEEDWKKLKRGIMYLKGTMHTKLNITIDSLSTITWYVDASYGVHYDYKGHTGMMMTLVVGAAMSMSKAQKLNTGRSTESELVGVYDALPDILWGKYFLKAQGHKIDHNRLLQDNKLTILLATNGMMSSSKKTKHIRHRFFN